MWINWEKKQSMIFFSSDLIFFFSIWQWEIPQTYFLTSFMAYDTESKNIVEKHKFYYQLEIPPSCFHIAMLQVTIGVH